MRIKVNHLLLLPLIIFLIWINYYFFTVSYYKEKINLLDVLGLIIIIIEGCFLIVSIFAGIKWLVEEDKEIKINLNFKKRKNEN